MSGRVTGSAPSGDQRIKAAGAALVLALAAGSFVAGQAPLFPSRNVNVIAGNGRDGDWTLQRQNEPSMACSSRNPLNCLAGANDYRTVDIPFPDDANRVIGDAWLGWYTTKDGGQTWKTRLLPGFPQDQSPEGAASPLKAYNAGADPVVRAGANGLFFYAGIAFTRSVGGNGTVFVARFIDNNNQENPDVASIRYLDTTPVMSAPSGTVTNFFIDKPWVAVDIPRTGATCQVGGGATGSPLQSVGCSRVYLGFTVFQGSGANERATVMFARSEDSGRTWSAPQAISAPLDADVDNDGVVTQRDIQAVARANGGTCQSPGYNAEADVNIDCRVNARDTQAIPSRLRQQVPIVPPVHQGATLAIDPKSGRLYVAWRQFKLNSSRPDEIQVTVSSDGGHTFTPPVTVSGLAPFDQFLDTTRFRSSAFPSMAADGEGRVYLAWTTRGLAPNADPVNGDARVVVTSSLDGQNWSTLALVDNASEPGHQFMPSLSFAAGRLQVLYYDQREDVSKLFEPLVDEASILAGLSRFRHSTDVRVAQSRPGASLAFESTRVSDYGFGVVPGLQGVRQLEYHPPNLPIFRKGTTPFIGDYVDLVPSQAIVATSGGWTFNTAPGESALFHAVWTDNRDVRPPTDGDWSRYTPPVPAFPRPETSGFDPSQQLPPCEPGFAATRNQNVYAARVTDGLFAAALGNSKPLGSFKRAFATYVQNATSLRRSYRLTINAPAGANASFLQFGSLLTLDVIVPPLSTVARSVFVESADPNARIVVSVVETQNGVPLPTGQSARIVLNPDPSNPDVDNPDVDNPDVDNPDVDNPDVDNAEVYNPDVDNGTVVGQANPDVDNPDVDNPDVDNVVVENPAVVTTDVGSPDVDNPDVDNPDVDNPDVDNFDLASGSLTDTTWTIRNEGNTSATYAIKLLLGRPLPQGFRTQLLVYRLYKTPVVQGCALKTESHNLLLINLNDPAFLNARTTTTASAPATITTSVAAQTVSGSLADPRIDNSAEDNLTVAMAPGDQVRVTVRVFDPNRADAETFDALTAITPALVAHAVDTEAVAAGETTPAVALPLVGSAPLPAAPTGAPYAQTLTSNGDGDWEVVGGALPSGLSLGASTGVISGTATTPGSFEFTVKFTRDDGVIDYQPHSITVAGTAALADLAVSVSALPNPAIGASPITYTITISNISAVPAAGVTLEHALPPGATYLSSIATQGACSYVTAVRCQLQTIVGGASAVVTVSAAAGAAGVATSVASISSVTPEGVVTNNIVETPLIVQSYAPCTAPAFTGPFLYETGLMGAFQMVLGELTGDAHRDAAVVSADRRVAILPGTPSGGFGAPIGVALPQTPQGITIADFDEDGRDDILVGTADSNLLLLINTGGGTFAPPATISVGDPMFTVDQADFNNDNDLDIIVGASNGKFIVLLGAGDGTFGPPQSTTHGTGIVQFVIDDFNSDGSLDLVASDRTTNAVVLFTGTLAGGFAAQAPLSPTGGNARVRRAGDVNGDGLPDVFVSVSNAPTAQTLIFLNDGVGGFSPPLDPATGGEGIQPNAGDVTGDNLPDLVTAAGSRSAVAIQVGLGNGIFAPSLNLAARPSDIPKITDVNGDQRADIVFAGGRPSHVQVYLNACVPTTTDLQMSVSDSVDPVQAGAPLTYTATIQNVSASPAPAAIFTLALPQTTELTSAAVQLPAVGVCTLPTPALVSCSLGTIPAGGSVVVDVNGAAYDSNDTPQFGTGSVTSALQDTTPFDNVGSGTTAVTSSPTTLAVTTSTWDGPGSLGRALTLANANLGPDTIIFNIPGAGPHVIQPSQAYGVVTSPVVLDGSSQPGYTALSGPRIVIDGALVGSPTADGLNLAPQTLTPNIDTPQGSTIRAMGFTNWQRAGLRVATPAGATTLVDQSVMGSDPSGTTAQPNAIGLLIASASQVDVGADVNQDNNVLAFNTGDGVRINDTASARLVRNRIFSNGGLGIDLGSDGVTANDVNDPDTGPNGRQNYPVLTSATSDGFVTTVNGTLNTTPGTLLPIQFFVNSSCDGTGLGEGESFLGSIEVTTNGSGNYTIGELFFEDTRGRFLTATAGTFSSEFSICIPVTTVP